MVEGAMCTIGLASAQWLGYGFFFYGNDPRQWRPVVALQCAPAIIVFCLILLLPESPRWLVKKGRAEEAHYILARLADKPMEDPDVIEDLESIKASFESQKGAAPFKYRELLEGGKTQTFRRVLLGFFIQSAQQISGINMVATYANTIIASSFHFDSETSHLLAACVGTEYAICSCLSLLFIERVGRRKIFMITAAGMSMSFIIISYISFISFLTLVPSCPQVVVPNNLLALPSSSSSTVSSVSHGSAVHSCTLLRLPLSEFEPMPTPSHLPATGSSVSLSS
jgi:MFS family permease